MKRRGMTLGWLVGAAARKAVGGAMTAAALLLAGCSGEDNLAEETKIEEQATKIHVTVGAGISDGDAATRATVEQTGTTRKLKFSAGDKLWVYRQKAQVGNIYVFAGTLAIGTIGTDGTTAQFSGDLSVLKFNSSAPDPDLSSLEGFTAVLIPAGSTSIKTEINQDGLEMLTYEEKGVATGALNDLMAKNTYVRGGFADASNVTLNASTAFFNCTVTGLEASTAYDVRAGNTGEPVSINSDGEGNLHFLAWYHLENEDEDGRAFEYNSDLRFVIGTNKCARLSGKSLYAKVYNMTRAAEPYTLFTVTDNATGDTVEPQNGNYNFNADADITVSGENEGEYILLWGGNDRVVLSGVTAKSNQPFINEQDGALNVVLSGANSITSTNPIHGDRAISSIGTLYLSGNGTLTVTAYNNSLYGIGCSNYNSSNNSDPSALAATGYIVSRSDTKDNGDGTYTWTYTVYPQNVDLASVTTETDGYGFKYFAAKNGQILTGNLNYNYKYVSIPDGATVTLSSVTFKNVCIQSNGAATINLEGTNTIENEFDYGILIESGTLTIQGSGSLSATGGDGTAGIGGDDRANLVIKSGNITAQGGRSCAGIGSFPNCEFGTITIEGGTVVATGGEGGPGVGSGQAGGSCGDITITGGNVTATGGEGGAGIGSGQDGTCGNITITGGNVTATGGSDAAGIGSGLDGSCGNISIANTVTSVTATSGGGDAQSIGAGAGGMCGKITIGCTLDESGNPVGGEVFEWGIDESPYTYTPTN